jgi:hypothetical protein
MGAESVSHIFTMPKSESFTCKNIYKISFDFYPSKKMMHLIEKVLNQTMITRKNYNNL